MGIYLTRAILLLSFEKFYYSGTTLYTSTLKKTKQFETIFERARFSENCYSPKQVKLIINPITFTRSVN